MAMDVTQSLAGLRARLAQFSGPQKVIVGLLAVVGLVAVVTFGRWVSAPSYGVLMAGLEPTDAAAITAQLDAGGVPYKLEANGGTVLVPEGDLQAQRLAVAAAGLPEGTTQGYELLDAQGMTSSSFQQKIAYQRAVEGELSKTLEQMSDVRTATVHLSLPDDQLYTDKATPARASVLLDTQGTLPRESVESVQRLVAAAVPDLEPDGVTVSDTRGTLLSGDGATAGTDEEQTVEDAAAARADSMLASVLGAGHAVVRVNAEMDPTTRSSESETYDPKKTVTLRRDDSKETYDTTGTTNGGVVSVPDPVASASTNGTGTYAKDENNEEYGVTRKLDKSSVLPGALKRLTVAVVLDTRSPGPSKQVVQDLVSNAVGLDPARGDTISVALAAFSGDTAPAPAPTTSRDWVRTGTTAFAVLLLLIVALAFLKAARRGTIAEIPLETLALPSADEPAALERAQVLALDTSARDAAEQDARILELVDSRPDEVGVLIRNWLSEPGEVAR